MMSLRLPRNGAAIRLARPVMEKAMPDRVAICDGVPTSSWTKIVTTGAIVRVQSWTISSTRNSARRPADPGSRLRPYNIDLLLAVALAGIKFSVTTAQTKASQAQVMAAHQKNGAR